MNATQESEPGWEVISSQLDEVLGALSDTEREAILLRYFQRKPATEMAALLGISSEAAQKRVARAVERMMFLLIILGATDKRAPQGFAPIAIGLGLTLIHLISIPVTNTSVNPARSTAVAVFAGGWTLQQLWLFWVAPIIGGALGAIVYNFLGSAEKK